MEELDNLKINEAVNLLMNHDLGITEARKAFKQYGLTPREITVAESLATINLFHFTFCRRWSTEGILKMMPSVIGEA